MSEEGPCPCPRESIVAAETSPGALDRERTASSTLASSLSGCSTRRNSAALSSMSTLYALSSWMQANTPAMVFSKAVGEIRPRLMHR